MLGSPMSSSSNEGTGHTNSVDVFAQSDDDDDDDDGQSSSQEMNLNLNLNLNRPPQQQQQHKKASAAAVSLTADTDPEDDDPDADAEGGDDGGDADADAGDRREMKSKSASTSASGALHGVGNGNNGASAADSDGDMVMNGDDNGDDDGDDDGDDNDDGDGDAAAGASSSKKEKRTTDTDDPTAASAGGATAMDVDADANTDTDPDADPDADAPLNGKAKSSSGGSESNTNANANTNRNGNGEQQPHNINRNNQTTGKNINNYNNNNNNKSNQEHPNNATNKESATNTGGTPGKDKNTNATTKSTPSTTTITTTNNNNNTSTTTTTKPAATAAEPAPPVLKGLLTYMNNDLARKHIIRGSWNFETSPHTTPKHKPQRFELIRTLGPDEDPTELPQDGTFHGSFSLAYVHISAKGKRKEKSKVIQESGVKIKFTERVVKDDDDDGNGDGEGDAYDVNGEGTNQYGVFFLNGTAIRDRESVNKQYIVEMRKKYAATSTEGASPKKKKNSKKRKLDKSMDGSGNGSGNGNGGSASSKPNLGESMPAAAAAVPAEPLPPPSQPHPSNVVCLRGKIHPTSSAQDGVIHTVSGMWSSGLDIILSDPSNARGLCNQFEYEYRGTVDTASFPISGKYTGWFNLTGEDGTRNRIPERDVTLKFKPNNEGFWNVEGKGSNMFGKYTISGTLDRERIITIFRHFQPAKVKKAVVEVKGSAVLSLPPDTDEDRMSLDDVVVPDEAEGGQGGGGWSDDASSSLDPLVSPEDGQYAALHRGVLRVNNDGAITCTGKWAMTRSHYNSNLASNFHFGLEVHHAKQGAEAMKAKGIGSHNNNNTLGSGFGGPTATCFPVDSPNYKGSFKMKRGTAKLQSVVDRQIVMKFRKNKAGSYNVYGKGVNSFGTFDLVGTLILHGKESGHVELYRIYQAPPASEAAAAAAASAALPAHVPSSRPKEKATSGTASLSQTKHGKALPTAKNPSKKVGPAKKTATAFPSVPSGSAIRRESSRATKLPSRLEEDDPSNARLMERCAAALKLVKEKDRLAGSFFAEPVDPVAHGIPNYHQIITTPMDLGTIQAKMDAQEIDTPEQFARLVRLVFDNAIKFNVDPTHIVHQAAKNLLSMFNAKFREIERLMEKKKKPTKKEQKELKKRQLEEQKRLEKEKKRKLEEAEDPTLRKIRLMHSSSNEVSKNLNVLKSASSSAYQGSVTRDEFNMQTNILNHLSTQVLQIQDLLTTLIPRMAAETGTSVAQDSLSTVPTETPAPPKKTKQRKKPAKTTKTATADSEYRPPVAAPAPAPAPAPRVPIEEVPLTLEEQQELTNAINSIVENMSEEKLNTVIEIIRESADLNDDDEEIDLEIDQLSTATQRKLLNFVNKNKPKQKKPKQTRKRTSAPEPKPKPKTNDSFFAFGSNGYGTDSDDEEPVEQNKNNSGFQINEDTAMDDDEEEEDAALDTNWNISKPIVADADNVDDDDEDDAWAEAKGASEAQKALEKERQAREEKMKQEAEKAKEKSLAESMEIGKKLQEERKAKEAEEARLRQQKEKEEKDRAEKAREQALMNLQEIKPTVDLEGQRDFMKEYEQSFCDKDLNGGASPSSDFGF